MTTPGWRKLSIGSLVFVALSSFGINRLGNRRLSQASPLPTQLVTSQKVDQGHRGEFDLATAPGQPRLWLLKSPGEITEYNLSTFEPSGPSVTIPQNLLKGASENEIASRLEISHRGQMLFRTLKCLEPEPNPHCNFWFRTGQSSTLLDSGFVHRKETAASGATRITDSLPEPHLSTDGEHLIWFQSIDRTTASNDADVINSSYRVWQTDLSGGHVENIYSFRFPPCKCETGARYDFCPEAKFWAPASGVNGYFFVTHLVEGQLQSQYLDAFLFRQSAGNWVSNKLSEVAQVYDDAAENGSLFIETVPDNGCCGWENGSDDQTLLVRDGKKIVLFDEFAQFNNADYDVSFFTDSARLSFDLSLVGMTITSSYEPGNEEIRGGDSGKPNPAELKSIKKNLSDLPGVEVVTTTDPSKRVVFLPHATFAGWLSNKEILIVRDHLLAAYDVTTGAERKSNLTVADAKHVFLR